MSLKRKIKKKKTKNNQIMQERKKHLKIFILSHYSWVMHLRFWLMLVNRQQLSTVILK